MYSFTNVLTNNVTFKVISSIAICLNAIVLGLDHAGISDSDSNILE